MYYTKQSPFLKDVVSDQYAFFWEVYTGKYVLSHVTAGGRSSGRPAMITCRIRGKRFYAPFRRSPVLHRLFGNLSGDKSMLDFASTYGFLDYSQCDFSGPAGNPPGYRVVYEPLEKWRREIRVMKSHLARWDFIRSGSEMALGRVIDWREDGVHFTLGGQSDLIAARDTQLYDRWLRQGKPLREPALHYTYNFINSRIYGGVSPRALPAYSHGVYLTPDNLLTAMWVMFMWEVIGETRPHYCSSCGGWFDPRRSTRQTCGDRCRKRLSRARQKLLASAENEGNQEGR